MADFKFRLNNRVVSFVFITDKPAFADLYSVNRDKWIRMPSKESRKNLDINTILEGFDNKYQRAKLQSNTVKQYDKYTCFVVEDIMQLYKSLTKSKDSSIYEHIVYKLLQASGILQDINQTIYTVTNSFLSL